MSKEINSKIAIGTILFFAVVLGGLIWIQAKKQIGGAASHETVPAIEYPSLSGCVEAGQIIPPGKNMQCCSGLTGMFGGKLPDGKCVCTEKDNDCGGTVVCAPCGNGKCETNFGENDCVCPKDCK